MNNILTKSAEDAMHRMAAEYGIDATGPKHEVWAAIHEAERREAAEYRLPEGPTTIIWGRNVLKIARERGLPSAFVSSFQGGYDDYDGSCYWAEVPGIVEGRQTRFSPSPGRWMSGVRV